MEASGGKKGQKRASLPSAQTQKVVDLSVELLVARCGAAFGRGFRLKAIGQRLYVQLSGRKVPLYLDFDADPVRVQERATRLRRQLSARGGVLDSEQWALECQAERVRKGKNPSGAKTRLSLDDIITKWKRLKAAEGVTDRTLEMHYLPTLRRLDEADPLGDSSLLAAIEATRPRTWSRRRTVAFLRRLCAVCGVPWNGALLDCLQGGPSTERRKQPFFTDQEIEALVSADTGLEAPWRRVLATIAVYGLRPWEAWVVEPCKVNSSCAWVSVGKTSSRGANPPRRVPPFHPQWLDLFELERLWRVSLPELNSLSFAGNRLNQKLRRRGLVTDPTKTAYGLRHAYARRIHSPRYRVTDAHGALFMGHTVAVHNRVYRDWLGGEDPIGIYFDRPG